MTREIKFRAYDGKQMRGELTLQEILSGTTFGTFKDKPEKWQWLQFTGLTDRHGVEIYEGDIVKFWHENTPQETTIYQVIYDAPAFKYYRNKYDIRLAQNSGGVYHRFEIIGNIYENPELLGDNNANS